MPAPRGGGGSAVMTSYAPAAGQQVEAPVLDAHAHARVEERVARAGAVTSGLRPRMRARDVDDVDPLEAGRDRARASAVLPTP